MASPEAKRSNTTQGSATAEPVSYDATQDDGYLALALARRPPREAPRLDRAVLANLLRRAPGTALEACHAVSRTWRDIVADPRFRPEAKKWWRAVQRARRALAADDRTLRQSYTADDYGAGHFERAEATRQQGNELATLNTVCLSLRSVAFPPPPDGWWAALPAAVPGPAQSWAAAKAAAVWCRPAFEGEMRARATEAHAAASVIVRDILRLDPDAEPWVAAAAWICCSGDEWCGPFAVLTAMEHRLEALASQTVREFGSRLLRALVDCNWHRARLHVTLPWRSVLLRNLEKAVDTLDVPAPKFRLPRPPPPPPSGTLTDEQEAYASYPFDPKTADQQLLIIKAYAGTGKTFTTVEAVRRNQSEDLKVAVYYFNVSMFEEMQPKLRAAAPGAHCSTLDAAVLRQFRGQVPGALASRTFDAGTLPAATIRRACEIDESSAYKGTLASHTRKVLAKFVHSLDLDVPSVEDPCFYRIQKYWAERGKRLPDFRAFARTLWKSMISLSELAPDSDCKLSFAELAKCYHLRDHRGDARAAWMYDGFVAGGTIIDALGDFGATKQYQIVIIDEAQDTSAVHYYLFVERPRKMGQRIAHALVGDPYQSLYGWRGARNALRDAEPLATDTRHLTRSYRFGQEVAHLATMVLQDCGNPATPALTGVGPAGEVHFEDGIDAHDWRSGAEIVVLSRTNKGVALAAYEYTQRAEQEGRTGGFLYVRGADLARQRRLVDRLVELRDGGGVASIGEDSGDWRYFQRLHAEDAIEDPLLKHAMDLVVGTPDPQRLLERISNFSTDDPESASVEVCTVHQFKGREKAAVRLLPDVAAGCVDRDGYPNSDLLSDHLCIVYTALSRAQRDLYLPPTLRRLWLNRHPPRAVLCPASPGAERYGWCGVCGRDDVDISGDDDDVWRDFQLRPASSLGGACCKDCALFHDIQTPLRFPTRSGNSYYAAGWEIAPEVEETQATI